MTARIPEQVAGAIDYTDVRKDVTYADIERICLEAVEHRLGAVVVPSVLVRRAAACLTSADVGLSCYVGYPFGTQAAGVKAREAEVAVEHGATELDVVLHHGTARAARWPEVEAELATVKNAAGPALLKLVIEASILSDDELSTIARTAADAGYALIANTAGFRIVSTRPETQTSASPTLIGRLVDLGGGRIQTKACGGVWTREDIDGLLAAGAARVRLDAEPGLLRHLTQDA
jgi:deoxyribose-phosphate aldolase